MTIGIGPKEPNATSPGALAGWLPRWEGGYVVLQFVGTSSRFVGVGILLLGFVGLSGAQVGSQTPYVGIEACRDCHESEYDRYQEFAKKARSFDSIKKMQRRFRAP